MPQNTGARSGRLTAEQTPTTGLPRAVLAPVGSASVSRRCHKSGKTPGGRGRTNTNTAGHIVAAQDLFDARPVDALGHARTRRTDFPTIRGFDSRHRLHVELQVSALAARIDRPRKRTSRRLSSGVPYSVVPETSKNLVERRAALRCRSVRLRVSVVHRCPQCGHCRCTTIP